MRHNFDLMIQAFVVFLKRSRFSEQSIRNYKCIVEKFLFENPNGINYRYKDILGYLDYLNRYEISKVTKQAKLTALKKFFDFLIETDHRNDHPCKTIFVKTNSKRNVIHADLFSMNELESLLEREERYEHLKSRNNVVISLLIYQGLLPGEIVNLKLQHLDMDTGTVYVNSGRLLTKRRLPLLEHQEELIREYIYVHRKRMLLKGDTEFLLLNYQGSPLKVDDVNYLIQTMKDRFPERNLNSKIIRDSVISYWMNVKNIPPEQVQLLAGHRWISSTLRYKQANIQNERDRLNEWFPV